MAAAREAQNKQFGYWLGASFFFFFSYSHCCGRSLLWSHVALTITDTWTQLHNTTHYVCISIQNEHLVEMFRQKMERRETKVTVLKLLLEIATLPWKNLLTFAPFKTLQVINVTWCIQVTLFGGNTRKHAVAKICFFVGNSEADCGNITEMAPSYFTSNGAFLTTDILTCHSIKFTGVTNNVSDCFVLLQCPS